MHVIALLCALAAVSSASAEPLVTPQHQQVVTPATAVVRCGFQQPLLDCRVRASEHWLGGFDQMLDFSNGSRSASAELRKSDGKHLATASYAGDGLAAGHCGASLAVEKHDGWLVALIECYGLTEDRGWSRGFGLVTARDSPVLAVTARTPRLVVAAPDTDVAVLLRVPGALRWCAVKSPAAGRVEWLFPTESPPSYSRYRSHGAGAGRGECGAALPEVTRPDAGVWSWWAWEGDPMTFQATVVVVSVAPVGRPELTVHNQTSLRVGGQLTATCRAPPGAPPATLTWVLDGKVVRQDDGNDTVSTSLPWDAQASVQTFSRLLTEDDVGKRLECRANHLASSWSGRDSWQILDPCENRVKQLEDRYNRERKNDTRASASGSYASSTWLLLKLCGFRDDVVRPRTTVTSVARKQPAPESTDAELPFSEDEDNPSERCKQSILEHCLGQTASLPVIPCSASTSTAPQPRCDTPIAETTDKKSHSADAQAAIIQQMTKVVEAATLLAIRALTQEAAVDEDTAFGKFIIAALKPLDDAIKDDLKAEIMQLLRNAKQQDRRNKGQNT